MTPPPGSPEAVERGCECPIIDNARGRGAMGTWCCSADPVFIISGDCPLHAKDLE